MRKPSTAFVVEIDADPASPDGQLHGRVEHVVSGAAHEFDSASALVGFIEQVLQPPAPEAQRKQKKAAPPPSPPYR